MSSSRPIELFLPVEADLSSAQNTRNKLLRAGIACFAELGYHTASTRLVETAADVKRNLITHHWGSKEAFWKACVDTVAGAFGHDIGLAEDQAANVEGVERLRYFVRAFVRASARFPEIQRIMADEGKRDEERLRWIVERHVRPLKARVADVFDTARAAGAVPPIDLPSFYYTLVGGVSIYAMSPECRLLFEHDPGDEKNIARHADAVARLLIRDPLQDRLDTDGGKV